MSETNSSPNKRIEYIDALRGFTMILVVFQHIATFCWGIAHKDIPSLHEYFMQIRMPMFFFISGFVLYKSNVDWSLSFVRSFLRKKFFIQIIPTIVFLLVFVHVYDISLMNSLTSNVKSGYWFTYTLFEYFIFYSILRFCFRKGENKWDILILIIASFFYLFKSGIIYDAIPLSDKVKGFLGMAKWYYFFFFVLGTMVRKHYEIVQKWLDGKWLILLCLIVYFLLNAFGDVFPKEGSYWNAFDFVLGFVLSITGMTILFAFFRTNQSLFTKDKMMGFSLQYIGRRTLDVYLIHYFFIPFQLSKIVHVFEEYPMPVVETTCSLLLALVVIAFCLLVSNILRLSPFLAHWLFGVKYKKGQTLH